MPAMFQALDSIGTVHYSRFTELSEKTMLFLGDFDGEFGQLMLELARHSGAVFDTILAHVDNPPQTPVASNAEAFVEWTADHLLHSVFTYTAYPGATAKEIKALAAAAGVKGASRPNVFLVILPTKSPLAYVELQTPPEGEESQHPRRPGQGRHSALRSIHPAWGPADGLLYRLRRLVRQVHR